MESEIRANFIGAKDYAAEMFYSVIFWVLEYFEEDERTREKLHGKETICTIKDQIIRGVKMV